MAPRIFNMVDPNWANFVLSLTLDKVIWVETLDPDKKKLLLTQI